MDKYIGKRLDGRYEIQELIGVGGMAVVYSAYDTEEDKIVAIKILKDEFLGNQEFIRRFKNESKAIAVLSDPNIVRVYDFSFGTKIQYIVMEYIDGITLKEYISQQKIVKWKDAISIISQILSAIKHAHSKGVIHRDIKPQNIMLLENGTIKVTDFGIARFPRNETQTVTDRAIGSVHYISPEQAKGSDITEKADIYSIGVILYEMLTGKLPFEAENAVSVAIMQMQSNPTPPRHINETIPEGLEEITIHAMQKSPDDRYSTADEMLRDIERFKKDPDISFEYKYFVDNNPTRYVDSINNVRGKTYQDDNLEDEENNEKKSKSGFIAGGIAVVVTLVALVFILLNIFNSQSARDIEVPNLIGLKLAEVQEDQSYKFVWKVESKYDPTKPEGIILDQDPAPGTKKVKEGSTITLMVNSSGVLVKIPIIVGLEAEIAKAKLENAGLKYEILMITDEETAAGLVKSSDPQESSKVPANTTIRLYVSKGPAEETVTVPDVIGKTLTVAKNELVAAGLKISENITYEYSEKNKDTILSTNPLPGSSCAKGYSVKLTVSSGQRKEKIINVSIPMPEGVERDILVKIYLDDVLQKAETVLGTKKVYNFTAKGFSGKKKLMVKLDDVLYKVYELNFDKTTNNITTLESHDFNETGKGDYIDMIY